MEDDVHIKYRRAIDWIAQNDEASIDQLEELRDQVTVIFCADMFEKEPLVVAKDVLERRKAFGLT